MPARAVVAAAALVVAGTLSACGGAGDAPRQVAVGFYAAIGEHDGDAACAALAAPAAEAVAQDEGTTCAEAIVTGDVGDDLAELARDAQEGSARVAGRQAQVRFGTDTVFLARSGSGWVVTAVGCDPRPGQPYDCEVAS